MCCLALGTVSTTSSSQLICGFSTVNVEPSFLVTTSPAAQYSAVRVLMVASRMSRTGALDSFFLPFVVISLPIRFLLPLKCGARRLLLVFGRLLSAYYLATGRTMTVAPRSCSYYSLTQTVASLTSRLHYRREARTIVSGLGPRAPLSQLIIHPQRCIATVMFKY